MLIRFINEFLWFSGGQQAMSFDNIVTITYLTLLSDTCQPNIASVIRHYNLEAYVGSQLGDL